MKITIESPETLSDEELEIESQEELFGIESQEELLFNTFCFIVASYHSRYLLNC